MVSRERREALRGAEEETVDLFAEVLSSEQWAEMLKDPLERAAEDGKKGLAQKLVRAGAKIGSALHAAAQGGHEEVANDLLANGASVAAKDGSVHGWTSLHYAAEGGNTGMVQLLLHWGADTDVLDSTGYTPLYMATGYRNEATALALLTAGADVNLRCGMGNRSVVHMAAVRGHVDILRVAVERGVDMGAVESDRSTPLHAAAVNNKVGAIDVLVEAGVNIEAWDDQGWTPLQAAARQANIDAVLALLRHGADVNVQDNGRNTPLHSAVVMAGTEGAADVVDALLKSGADETILNDEGKTPAEVVAKMVGGPDLVAEDLNRVGELLANAPAERAWRRRGYLVLCRAQPDRMQQAQGISSACGGVAPRTQSGAELGRTAANGCTGEAAGRTMVGRSGCDWAVVVARVLGLQEEGIFRTIVGYL